MTHRPPDLDREPAGPAAHRPRFSGTTAVVTGAASGIGAATARRLADEGASVVLGDIDDARGAALARELGPRARFVRCDVATPEGWEALHRAAAATGGAHLLVSNAALQVKAPVHELPQELWQRHLDVGLTAAYLGVRAFVADLGGHAGSLVLVSSVHAVAGMPGHPAYAAAKGGLMALTRQLAVEYGPRVRVNCVVPGPILTPAWDTVPEEARRRSVAQTAAGRFGRPEEVASAIAFLASADATYITGTSLVVDGGWSVVKDSA
jgi:NAD(P)-dependent dehydrogenase (short-subunit alcohol dehydrogenase family)